ncbi:aromatic prenyltransferase [Aspergillus varians]
MTGSNSRRLVSASKTMASAAIAPTKTWEKLSQWLPSGNADTEYWWKLTGKHLATMLETAGYSTEAQWEALIFHYHWIVPYLGPAPGPNSSAKWKSVLSLDGGPIEYSWKWNTPSGGKPDVRYTIEPVSLFSGTPLDPLNQLAMSELLHRIAAVVPSIDLSWTNHLLATLFDHDRSKYAKEGAAGAPLGTTMFVAVEWLPKGLSLKTYFAPRRLGQTQFPLPVPEWEVTIAELVPTSTSRVVLQDFLSENAEGKLLIPICLAVDNVIPEKSRLKWYLHSPHSSFASVREVMTMGGKIDLAESQLEDLRSLIAAATGIPADFPEDAEVQPTVPESELPPLPPGFMYYFDIAPGPSNPDIKVYIPIRRYGGDDRTLVQALTEWMNSHGRSQYTQGFQALLESIAQHRGLEEGKGIQTFVSCLFKKSGELDITTYIGPEALHPLRFLKE